MSSPGKDKAYNASLCGNMLKWKALTDLQFPALTEALTIEHDVKLAQKEADELDGMIRHMADKLV
jgi:hypothetical protein